MLIGVPGTSKGATRDTKYTYMVSLDDEMLSYNSSEGDFKGLAIHVKETETRLDRSKTTYTDAWEKHDIITPLRARFFGMQSYYERITKKLDLDDWSNDIDEFDTWVREDMPEMWIPQEMHDDYQDRHQEGISWPLHHDPDFNFIVDAVQYGPGIENDGAYIVASRVTHKYKKRPNLHGFPSGVSIQSYKHGTRRRVYLTYVMEHTLLLPDTYFGFSINGRVSGYFSRIPLFSKNSYKSGGSRYKKGLTCKYYVPVVMELRYEDKKMKRKFIASPVASTSNKIVPGFGDFAHNFRLVPRKKYNKPLKGGSGTQCDADLYLPSNNRCLTASYMDYEEKNLMVITTYEGGTSDTSFPEHRLYVSRYDTESTIEALPERMKYIDLLDVIKGGGATHYGDDTNISHLDVTKWQDNYIISVCYDKGTGTSLNTVLLKMPVGTSYGSSDIEFYTKIKNNGFAGVQGLKEGWML